MRHANIQNPALFTVLHKYLVDNGTEEGSINDYEELWKKLKPHQSYPCPLCYTQNGQISHLVPLNAQDGYEPVRCQVCRETYYIPIPD